MNALSLMTELEARGVSIVADGGELEIEAPGDVLSTEILDMVREHKPALMSLLAQSTLANEAALEAAHSCGHTANGWPVELDAGAAYRENAENQEAAA
jgi:hypothetical protein